HRHPVPFLQEQVAKRPPCNRGPLYYHNLAYLHSGNIQGLDGRLYRGAPQCLVAVGPDLSDHAVDGIRRDSISLENPREDLDRGLELLWNDFISPYLFENRDFNEVPCSHNEEDTRVLLAAQSHNAPGCNRVIDGYNSDTGGVHCSMIEHTLGGCIS